MENLASAFVESARKHVSKTAVFYGNEEIQYGVILSTSGWFASELVNGRAVREGDRVGIWLRNGPAFLYAFFGIVRAGAVAVPINNFLKPQEVEYMLGDCGIEVLITERAMEGAVADLCRARPNLRVVWVEEIPAEAAEWAAQSGVRVEGGGRKECDLAVLIYTSGTTGRPKGAMLTHGNLLHNVDSCRQILEVVELDRFVLMLPMFHSFMLTVCILLPLLTGGSIVLIKSLSPAKSMIGEILAGRGTVLPAMAQVFRALSQLPPGIEVPSLRLCISGAGPLPMEILRGFGRRFPAIRLIEGYGLSEASPVVSVNPIRGASVDGSIGLPIPNVEMSVQDDVGTLLPDGTDGEICVRGGNVMAGYWNAPGKTADTLVNGWLRTGDIGYRRVDGYYFITDRKKDMLKPNGINVYPREIEEVIQQFPGVKECAVVGEPDERRGERPVAFLALDPGVAWDEKEWLAFLRERLADFKLPRRAIVLEALPRNATGKILKTELRDRIAAGA